VSVADRLASLTPEQRALFEALRQKQRKAAPASPPPIERVSGPRGVGDWPLTFDQERLWFLHQLDPESSSYNMVTATRLTGDLDAAALEAAIDATIDRHGAWRTTFPVVDGRPVQRVAPELCVRMPLVDLEGLPADRREGAVLELAREDARCPFSLERGPLVRATLARLSPLEHVCMLAIHHIVSDLVSFQLFWNELALLYSGSSLPFLPVQYADFAVWQRQWLTGEVLQHQLDWWREQLCGFPLVLDVPGDRPRPPEQTSRGGRLPLLLDSGPTEALRTLARREGATRFMAILALCAVQLHRLSGQERLIAGTINANRSRPEVEPLFGFFVTQLPLAVDLSGDPTFRELLGRVRTAALGAFAHQHLPFGKLVEALEPERDASRMPVVQTVVQLLEALVGGSEARLGDLILEGLDVDNGSAAYDLMLGFVEHADHLAGHVEYNADLFDRTTVARLSEGLAALLDAAAADPGLRLSALPAFTAAGRHQMLAEWNDSGAGYPRGETLHELIQAQVDRTPDAVAVTFAGASLTFRELDGAANRLARRLRSLGVGPEVRVGVRLERSLEMVVALLAVLKAGGAWVPIDPASPPERQTLLLDEAVVRLVLTPEWVEVEESSERLTSDVSSGNAAYVIFTSGSTGRPKGVVNTHAGIHNRLLWMQEEYGLGPDDRVLQKTPFGFDVSVWEFFWPLMTGARLVIAQPGGHQDPAYLVRTIAEEGVTTLHFVPSMLQAFLEEPDLAARVPSLKRVIASGEALSPELRQRFLARLPGVELHNLYGPTEAAVDVTFWDCRAEGGARVPIGRPVANTRIQLLDRERRPVPIGATGELCIGGVQVARGYLGRPDLTAERFVPDPVLRGERLYRTGDLARWLPDGAIEYLGRLDFQMKVRGFRVEPGEIEAALTALPGIREATVLLREDRPGDRRLVAYVTPEDLDAVSLREGLRRRLPEPLVPSAFVMLPELPLTANGKLDRRALAAPDFSGAEPDVEPHTELEREIAAIWAGVLGIDRIGTLRSFFDLGGHSLLATQLVMRMREAFGVELPLRAIFQATTVAAQAELVEKARAGGKDSPRVQPIVRVSRAGDLPLSFAQERLWFLDQLTPGSPVYNVPIALAVRGRLDVAALERAFAEVVRRHEILRTSFPLRGSRPVQEIAPPTGLTLTVEDFSPDAATGEALRPFDLARGPILRTRLLRLAPEEHVLLLTVHHIAADLWAAGILVREVAAIYSGERLPELPIQYADFAAWQRQWLDGAELERQLAFWRRELAGAPPALELPTDRPRPPVESFRGAGLPWSVDRELSRSLQGLGRARGATLFMTVIAALGILLSRWTGQDDLMLGSPIANRPRPELDGLIGMFVNTLAIRIRLAGASTFGDLLAEVRRTSLDAFEHQDLPFERLVEELKPRRDLSRHPLFQVALALQNVRMGTVEVPGLTFEPLSLASATTKFDLTFTLFEGEDGLAGQVEYATDLFDATTVEHLLGHLRNLLEGIVEDPGAPVEDLPMLDREERTQLLAWSGAAPDFPRQATIHGLFAEQAARTPDAVAVVHGDEALTYSELAARAGRIAARLLKLGVKPETRVAVMGERSLDLVAALLGILQAGCAYLPLDPEHPAERQALILADAGASLLLSRDEEEETFSPPPVSPDQLAYVMYTSGSTGVPKGVAVTHRNVVRLVRNSGFMTLGPEQTFLQLAPVAFDASTLEIWAPLLNGGRLVLFPGRRASLDEIGETVARHGVTSMFLTTGLFHQMVDERLEVLRPLRQLLTGGEVISPAHMRRALAGLPGCRVIACYGPTENTTFSTTHPMTSSDLGGPVPLGRPIGGTRIYVLDAALRPVPEGVWGELCAGGDGVARGYLGRPDLTAERFVPDPYGPKPGGRLYRTGDLVRWRGGVLEFLGRRDGQVKLRGNRIELGEVEAALTGHPAVREAAVVLREDRLVGYVTGDPDPAEMRRFLAVRLPDPMIPSFFVVLDRFPLTPNGKVDRRAFPAPEGTVESYAPPETPVEESLTAACAEVLGIERVGVRDNFFALGGHSLLATRLVARLRERYGLDVPLQMVFDAVDLRDLADRVVERELADVDDSVLAELLGEEVG
jgi:amino acid adenylation domain-containing protein